MVRISTSGSGRLTAVGAPSAKRCAQARDDTLHVIGENDYQVALANHRYRTIDRVQLVGNELDPVLLHASLEQSVPEQGGRLSRRAPALVAILADDHVVQP